MCSSCDSVSVGCMLVLHPNLLELVQQCLVADPQFVCGALAVAAGGNKNLGDQLTLDLRGSGTRGFLQRERLAVSIGLDGGRGWPERGQGERQIGRDSGRG